ncbi:MAG TPA: hypothetical protein PLU50_05080, partial [Pseudobdellovibrionaceae bacterium]|nr:hypothetical protein [Pseudobdellovibrionaceae bacterium]
MTKNKISKSLVVGFGSIGQRHAAIMAELGLEVAVVSRREISHQKVFHDLSEAIVSHQPDLIVIANETNLHFQTLQFLNQFSYNGLA